VISKLSSEQKKFKVTVKKEIVNDLIAGWKKDIKAVILISENPLFN
jgi:hypothetical protein